MDMISWLRFLKFLWVIFGGLLSVDACKGGYKQPSNDVHKGHFMRELRESTFPGDRNDDANENLERVLDIEWHDGASNRRTSNINSNGITAITSKLDSNGKCEETHLDKECPLNKEVKGIDEVKYGEFRRPFPNNGENRARYRIGPPGYYNRMDNHLPFGTTNSSTFVGHFQAIIANDGLPLYTPFDYSFDETDYFSSMSYVSDQVIQEIEEVKEIKKEKTPRDLPIMNHYVAPYKPYPFLDALKNMLKRRWLAR
ncbi:hypothetical protein Tco_0127878 [Tanacetum coccineum]